MNERQKRARKNHQLARVAIMLVSILSLAGFGLIGKISHDMPPSTPLGLSAMLALGAVWCFIVFIAGVYTLAMNK